MPIVDLDPLPLGQGIDRPEKGFVTPGADQVEDRPSFKDLTEATFRRENMLASAAQANNGIDTTPDPDFKPFDHLKGTPYEPHFSAFLDVQNRPQFDEVKRRIDQETEDRKTVDAAPLWMSLPASLMANVTDPTLLAPGGAFVRGAKGGWSLLKSGALVGTAAAGGTAGQEAFLHGTQFTRTPEESAFSIGSSFVLGGLLGTGGSALLNKAEWKAHVRALDRELVGSSTQSIKDNPLTAPIYEDIAEKLRTNKPAWMGEEEIDKYAAVTAARYQARAERLGGDVSAHDLYKGEGIEVRGGGPVESGRSFDQRLEGEVYDAIRKAYDEVIREQKHEWMSLTRLRRKLDFQGFGKAEIDAALQKMGRSQEASLVPDSNQKTLTAEDRAAALKLGGEDKHLLSIDRSFNQAGGPAAEGRAFDQGGSETIKASAVKLGDKIYTGVTHADAMEAASKETGKTIDQLWDLRSEASNSGLQPDGFVTDTGRFVTRKEATEIANKADQIDKTKPYYMEGKFLTAEYLKQPRSFNQSQPSAPTFFSAASRAIDEAKQDKAPGAQWLGMLKNKPGVKPEEMEWLGLEGWLKEQKSVTKAQVQDYIRANSIELKEVKKGAGSPINTEDARLSAREELDQFDRDMAAKYGEEWQMRMTVDEENHRSALDGQSRTQGATKFSQYQLPGGENYRELLLTLPERNLESEPRLAQVRQEISDIESKLYNGVSPAEEQTLGDRLAALHEQEDAIRSQTRENFRSSHWDEPNVLAHIRFNDRVIDGQRTLFIEEVQSDWHQKGKKKGYRPQQDIKELPQGYSVSKETLATGHSYYEVRDQGGELVVRGSTHEEAVSRALQNLREPGRFVPDAPFKTSWPELSLKRMIRYASENGYDQVAWTPGKVQAERYDLSKQIKRVEYSEEGQHLRAVGKDGSNVIERNAKPEDLPDIIGKEVAEKILKAPEIQRAGRNYRYLEGLDLQVGGEGMKGFYDEILPATANKLTKKYGARVGKSELDVPPEKFEGRLHGENQTGEIKELSAADMRTFGFDDGHRFAILDEEGMIQDRFATRTEAEAAATAAGGTLEKGGQTVHTLPLTPELKQAAMGGFPLFQKGNTDIASARGRITLGSNKAIIDLFESADRSTFLHEMGHKWLDELAVDASKADVPQALKDDLGTVLRWLKVDKVEDLKTPQHEQWAKAFERYLAEGKAPSSALAQAFESFKRWLTSIYKSLAGIDSTITDDIRGVMDRMLASDAEMKASRAYGPGSVGAAASTVPSLGQTAIAGRVAGGAAAATQRLNPGLRMAHSDVPEVRDIGMNLAEMSQYIRGNQDGLASPVAVETLRKEWNGGLMTAVADTRAAYREFRKGGGSLSRPDFQAAVGRAMRRGDEDPIPEVAKVAKAWRKNVFDPLKEAAIEAKLLPEDVAPETAISYFSRLWNRQKLIAQEGGFKQVVMDWINQNMPTWERAAAQSTERRLEPLRREISDIEMAKLRRGEERKGREDEIAAGDFTESDIRNALRIVQGGAPKPKGVKTLTSFVVDAGGIFDPGGDVRAMGINNRSRPGLLRNERKRFQSDGGGHGLDEMTQKAWEAGYFPDHVERPTSHDFLEALSDDFNKRRAVLRVGDKDAYKLQELIDQLDQDLARVGASPTEGPRFSTSEETKGIVDRVFKAMDAQADQRLEKLKKTLTERETDARLDHEARFGSPKDASKGIADEVFNTLTGRISEGVRPEFITIKARGPLKERTFNIPDELVERWLEDDVNLVGRRYSRIMSADVELARKFGSVDMADQIAKVHEGYDKLRADVTDEKRLLKIAKREGKDIEAIEGVRDIIRGTYTQAGWENNFGRIVRIANNVQYILKMGQVVLSSLTEPVRVVAAKGLLPFMGDAFKGLTNIGALKMSVEEARLAGNINDKILAHRLSTVADLTDFYGSRGPVEKFLDNATNVASSWNGIRLWTDGVKMLASTMIQNKVLKTVSEYGAAAAPDKRYLNFLGINQGMADRIAKQFSEHGADVNGVHVANTEKWTDEVAKRTYRAALNKDLDSMVVTRGAADLPLWAHRPIGRLIFQFNSFNLASHQRVLLRGLQEGHARFLSTVVALTSMGMLQTYLAALATNSVNRLPDPQANPGWWLAEGLDRSGIFMVPMQIANGVEKLTGGLNPIKTPMKAGDEGSTLSQKNRNRGKWSSLLGPTAGTIDDVIQVAGIPQKLVKGEEVTKGEMNAGERLLPFNSYYGIRQLLKYFINPPDS